MTKDIISYRTGIYRALFLPETGAEEHIDGLFKYATAEVSAPRTMALIRREKSSLHLEISCLDDHPETIHSENTENGAELWNGDLIEIFFGSMLESPWQIQCCIGAGGGRFDSRGTYDKWHARSWIDSRGWHAVVDFPYEMLDLRHGYISFNICRQVLSSGTYSSYSQIKYGFDEIPSHADLFFCDCATAWLLLSGSMPSEELSKENFCREVMKKSIAAGCVMGKPLLFNPDTHQMSIAWRTAGLCAAALEYRRSGTEEWMRVYANVQNGIVGQNSSLHRVDLNGLESGTHYDYRLVSLHYVDVSLNTTHSGDIPLVFNTFPEKPSAFSCGIFTDIHSQRSLLENWLSMPDFANCNFHIQLGDLLSELLCTNNIFSDVVSAFSQKCPEKPLAMVRGNHDQERHFAADYSLFNSQNGRTYGLFNYGDVCFMFLDTGNDNFNTPLEIRQPEALAEIQEKWIDNAVTTSQWTQSRQRIVLMHIPPNHREKSTTQPPLRLAKHLADARTKPTLMLCGHHHAFARLFPGESAYYLKNTSPFLSDVLKLPFPLIVDSNNTAILMRYSCPKLELTLVDSHGNRLETFYVNPIP